MSIKKAPIARSGSAPPIRYFTLESANKALTLVKRVTQDIVAEHSHMMRLRDDWTELENSVAKAGSVAAMRDEIERRISRLNDLREELSEIGCELKDWKTGLVDFPAMHEGRPVWLCWKPGEDEITHWHEISEGFAGRKPIPDAFGG
ncbi:MAG: DUF2203 domain-containing protein [Planctomycetes bacterium]|nr:DUF2203 domain-containing protein [Planctomycetota bacterium]